MELTASDLVWTAPNVDERLRKAFVEFTRLCKQHKIRVLLAFGSLVVGKLLDSKPIVQFST